MPQAAAKAAPKAAAKTGEKEAAAPKANRSNFSKIYPEDAPLAVIVEGNPKKKGSKSAARFEGYTKADTVGAALAAGVTYQDIAYDVGRGFIKVG